MVALTLDKLYMNSDGIVEPKFKVLFRVEIPRSKFTYVNAINKIVELNDKFDFDWIAVDRGYGETNIELLHKYGMENPLSGLAEKVIGYQFGEKLEVRDPHTMKKDRKHLKPFMVNNSVNVFEKKKIILDPSDNLLKEQLSAYKIERISSTGMPIYTDVDEHAVDALNLCLLIFEQKYGSLFKTIISTRILSLNVIDRGEPIKERDVNYEDKNNSSVSTYSDNNLNNYYSRLMNNGFTKNKVIGRQNTFVRRSF